MLTNDIIVTTVHRSPVLQWVIKLTWVQNFRGRHYSLICHSKLSVIGIQKACCFDNKNATISLGIYFCLALNEFHVITVYRHLTGLQRKFLAAVVLYIGLYCPDRTKNVPNSSMDPSPTCRTQLPTYPLFTEMSSNTVGLIERALSSAISSRCNQESSIEPSTNTLEV